MADDVADLHLRHAIFVSQRLLGDTASGVTISDRGDLSGRQCRVAVADALRPMSFPIPIMLIRGLGTKEQMARADARRIVATMTDNHPAWHGQSIQDEF